MNAPHASIHQMKQKIIHSNNEILVNFILSFGYDLFVVLLSRVNEKQLIHSNAVKVREKAKRLF